MTYQHKAETMWRHTAEIHAQHVQEQARQRSRLVAVIQHKANNTLRQHDIAVNPDSIILDQRIRRATRTLAHLWNPGPILLEGPAPHPFYINADVLNVDSGMQEVYHYDRRHHSADWIWDSATIYYIPRNHGVIDLPESVLFSFASHYPTVSTKRLYFQLFPPFFSLLFKHLSLLINYTNCCVWYTSHWDRLFSVKFVVIPYCCSLHLYFMTILMSTNSCIPSMGAVYGNFSVQTQNFKRVITR